jgi:hypothetical protein
MKKLESRINKLESKVKPEDEFLIVLAKRGEDKDTAIKRVIEEKINIKCFDQLKIIYLQFHS